MTQSCRKKWMLSLPGAKLVGDPETAGPFGDTILPMVLPNLNSLCPVTQLRFADRRQPANRGNQASSCMLQ